MTSFTFLFFFVPFLSLVLILLNLLFASHKPYKEKDSSFECGFHSFLGQNRSEFSISFFLFGLLFLIFDLEIVLSFPYVVSGYVNTSYGLIVIFFFFIFLTAGFCFELGKKALAINSRQINMVNIPGRFIPHDLDLVKTYYRQTNIVKPYPFINSSLQSGLLQLENSIDLSFQLWEYNHWPLLFLNFMQNYLYFQEDFVNFGDGIGDSLIHHMDLSNILNPETINELTNNSPKALDSWMAHWHEKFKSCYETRIANKQTPPSLKQAGMTQADFLTFKQKYSSALPEDRLTWQMGSGLGKGSINVSTVLLTKTELIAYGR